MTSVPEQPSSAEADPRFDIFEILPPADAERLADAMARIILAAAKVRAARAAAALEAAEAER